MRDPIQVEWLEDLERITRLESEWRTLETRTPGRSVFGSFDYLAAWYRHYGALLGSPLLGVARRDGRLQGLAPLHLWRGSVGRVPVRRLDLAGHNCEVGEFLLDPEDRECETRLLRACLERRGVDVSVWGGFPPDSVLAQRILDLARSAGRSVEVARYHQAVVDLSRGYDAYVRSMSGNFRKTLRRMEARVDAAGGARVDRIQDRVGSAELEAMLARMFEVIDRSWKAIHGGPMAAHHRAFYAELAERFSRRGMLDLAVLSIGGRDAAFIFALKESGVYYDGTISYADEFRDFSPGTWLMQLVLRALPSSGVHTVVSHGDHAYKRRWARDFARMDRCFLFAPTLLGSLSRLVRFHIPQPLRRRLVHESELGLPARA